MARTSLSVVFAGSGGSGAMTAGTLFLRSAARAGYYGLMTQLFGPQVRGGEAAAIVQIGLDPIECQPDRYDVLVALDWNKIDQFAPEIPLDRNSIIIADPANGNVSPGIAKAEARVLGVPMTDPSATRLEKALDGKRTNVFAAGFVGALAGLSTDGLRAALAETLVGKADEVARTNTRALERGIAAAAEASLDLRLAAPHAAPRWLITGNEAAGLGALRGGVRFVGCYPITPATDLVEWLSPELARLGGNLVLAEDELAAINMVVGASYGGVPSMTVTSGPGLSLMVETIGLAVAAEIPLVVIDVMRGGPSTGIPSKTEQSDINIALHGSHGDAPHVVVAPLSVSDCLATAEWSVYLAESLQCPVLMLSDQMLGQAHAVIDRDVVRPPTRARCVDDGGAGLFKRYAITSDPITPMPRPGTPGRQWVAEGLTHNEAGIPISAASAHLAQLNKRALKLHKLEPGDMWGEVWGDGEDAIVTFGSSVGPAREAARRLTAIGRQTRVIGLRQIAPLPMAALGRALAGVTRMVVLEQNHGAQLYHYLRGCGATLPDCESIARPGPLPFRPNELVAHLA
jgi:2-oxoglutarate ferredoxin oxidoreductase subunit alpha